MTTKHICWQPLHNRTSQADTSVGLLRGGGGDKQHRREHRDKEGEENGQQMKKLGEWKRKEENKDRVGREEAKDREKRDSQSMKQFDNLVILFLILISPERPAITLDIVTKEQRSRNIQTDTKSKKQYTHTVYIYINKKTNKKNPHTHQTGK